MGRREKNAASVIVGMGRCRGYEFIEKLDVVPLFAEQFMRTGPGPGRRQLVGVELFDLLRGFVAEVILHQTGTES